MRVFSLASRLSHRAMTVFSFIGAVTFSATSSAPTPLYHLYQQLFHLSPASITLIFGSYAFALLAALLTFGRLSDFFGRRPLILIALLLNAAALAIFIVAQSGTMLTVARIVQGFATGIAFPTFGATILDTDRQKAPLLNGITALLGLMTGSLLGGMLVAWAPWPTGLIYLVLLAVTVLLVALLAVMPETMAGRTGTLGKLGMLGALKPRISVPAAARATLLRVTPVNLASWSLGGFYLSLMPSLVSSVTGIASPFIGAAVVATLMLSGTASVILLRGFDARPLLTAATGALVGGVLVTMAGIQLQSVALLFLGTAAAGLGFGSIFASILRILLPLAAPQERAELFAAFLVESYLAFAVPAILAGFAAPVLGLPQTAYVYGAVIVILAMFSVIFGRTGLTKQTACQQA